MPCKDCGQPLRRHLKECPQHRPQPDDYPEESWKDWHLTQNGWRGGSWQHDGMIMPKTLPVPEGTVLTMRRTIIVPDRGADHEYEEYEVSRERGREKEIEALLAKHGPCPKTI